MKRLNSRPTSLHSNNSISVPTATTQRIVITWWSQISSSRCSKRHRKVVQHTSNSSSTSKKTLNSLQTPLPTMLCDSRKPILPLMSTQSQYSRTSTSKTPKLSRWQSSRNQTCTRRAMQHGLAIHNNRPLMSSIKDKRWALNNTNASINSKTQRITVATVSNPSWPCTTSSTKKSDKTPRCKCNNSSALSKNSNSSNKSNRTCSSSNSSSSNSSSSSSRCVRRRTWQ